MDAARVNQNVRRVIDCLGGTVGRGWLAFMFKNVGLTEGTGR